MENINRILFLADINSIHTERWVKNICAKGHRIFLFSLSQRTTNWQDGVKGFDFKCFGVDSSTIKSNRRFGKSQYFNARKAAKQYCKEIQPEIVHAHYASSYGTLAKYIGFEKMFDILFPNHAIIRYNFLQNRSSLFFNKIDVFSFCFSLACYYRHPRITSISKILIPIACS